MRQQYVVNSRFQCPLILLNASICVLKNLSIPMIVCAVSIKRYRPWQPPDPICKGRAAGVLGADVVAGRNLPAGQRSEKYVPTIWTIPIAASIGAMDDVSEGFMSRTPPWTVAPCATALNLRRVPDRSACFANRTKYAISAAWPSDLQNFFQTANPLVS